MSKNAKGADEKKFSAESKKIVKELVKAASSAGLELSLQKQLTSESPTKLDEKALERELFPDEDSPKKKKEGEETDLIVAEEAETGEVTIQDLNNYLGYSFGCCSYWLYFSFGLISSILQLYTTYFVSVWAD